MLTSIPPLQVVGIAGSLRRQSFNRGLLSAAQNVAPVGMTITIHQLAPIPFYNADVEPHGDPPPVSPLKSAVPEADALLIAVPEHHDREAGRRKNTLDWLSRLPQSVL